jgi:hypothetical protein
VPHPLETGDRERTMYDRFGLDSLLSPDKATMFQASSQSHFKNRGRGYQSARIDNIRTYIYIYNQINHEAIPSGLFHAPAE